MGQTPKLQKAITDAKIKLPEYSGAVKAAIDKGTITLDFGEVTATISGKSASKGYIKTRPEGREWLNGALALCDGDVDKVARAFFYGFDLWQKTALRPALVALLEGPAKIILRTAKDSVAAGLYDSIEEAVAAIKAARNKRGLDT